MRRNAALCFMICVLSALTDLLIFRQRYLDQLILYVQYHSEMVGFLRLGIHFPSPVLGLVISLGVWLLVMMMLP